MNYLLGLKILIVEMKDEPQYNGKVGVVTKVSIDPFGDWRLDGTWGGCAVYPKQDKIKIL